MQGEYTMLKKVIFVAALALVSFSFGAAGGRPTVGQVAKAGGCEDVVCSAMPMPPCCP
jgi:hypothetical protein